VVSQTDIGSAPNQIPLNQYLGDLAYQDAASIAGNVGIGGTLTVPAGTASLPAITTTGDPNTGIFFPAADTAAIATGGTERARITSGGNFLVGRTDVSGTNNTAGAYISPLGQFIAQTDANSGLFLNRFTSDGAIASFRREGTTVGTISVTASATAYNTSSDYRLKEAIQPMTGALARVAALKPVTYKWKVDGSAGEGFIAHELQEVAPYAVSGEKDGEQMQGVDYGKITPLLTAAFQEALAEIRSLKARVAELEAK